MPELPDVEMLRKYLAETSLHKKIERVKVLDDYVIKGLSTSEFISRLEEARFEGVERRGKFLKVFTDSEHDLALHFGMTGYLRYTPSFSRYEKYARVAFTFSQNSDLRYVSKRKLGGLHLVPKGKFDRIATIKNMGPEPLNPEFDFTKFKTRVERRSAMVKALLLDQSFIAGIGNVYGDEILFQAGIRPNRKISELGEEELKRLFKETKRVLRKAIQRKARLQGLEDSFLALHRGEGENCPRCGSRIRKMKVSGRTSYYCERCQR